VLESAPEAGEQGLAAKELTHRLGLKLVPAVRFHYYALNLASRRVVLGWIPKRSL
jgi:hypothetical protein